METPISELLTLKTAYERFRVSGFGTSKERPKAEPYGSRNRNPKFELDQNFEIADFGF